MNIYYAFLLTTVASFSTIIGGLFKFSKKNEKKIIILSAFIMIYLSIFELIPSSYNLLKISFYLKGNILIILTSLNIGLIFSKYISKKTKNNIGLLAMIALIVHNILEGIITFTTISYDLTLGFKLFLGIFIHNIPEGIILSTTNKKGLVITGFSELLGALISYLFLTEFMNSMVIGILYSIVSGIMLYLSVEMIKASLK